VVRGLTSSSSRAVPAVALALAAGGAYAAGAFGATERVVVQAVLPIVALAALVYGLRRRRLEPRPVWLLMAAAAGILAFGASIYAISFVGVQGTPPPGSWSDVLWFGFYPLAGLALGDLLRRRDGWTAILDAGLIAASLSLAGSALLVGPVLSDGASAWTAASHLGFLVADVVLAGLVLRALSGRTPLSTSLRLLIVGVGATVCSDLLWNWLAAGGGYGFGPWAELGWVAAPVLWAWAGTGTAHEPAGLTRPDAQAPPVLLALLTLGVVAAPVLIAVEVWGGVELDTVSVAVSAVFVSVLTIARLLLLVGVANRSRAALRATAQEMRTFLDGFDAISWQADAHTFANDFVSESVERMLGFPAGRFTEPGFWQSRLHPDDRDRVLAEIGRGVERGATPQSVYRMIAADGRIVWLRNIISYSRDVNGQPRKIRGLAVDVTALQEAQAELAASEERFRTLFDRAPVGMALSAPDGRIVAANAALHELLDYDEGLEGRTIDEITHPDDREQTAANLEALVSGATSGYRYEKRYLRRDGSPTWAQVTVASATDAKGGLRYHIAVVEDRNEARQLEDDLRQAQKIESIGELAAGVAHDFNNLLMAIRGHVELLVAEPERESRHEGALAEVLEATQRGSDLTKQLLAFSRRQSLTPETVDLNAEIRTAVRMLRPMIGAEIAFNLDLAETRTAVRIDPVQLQQVLTNLVLNARDAMPGGGTIAISTATTAGAGAEGADAVLRVTDDGVGMPPHVARRVFDPFYTTKEVGKGTGLGLSVVHGIITQSEGRITLESEPGHGTTFAITLPLVAATTANREETGPTPTTVPGDATVLLVEDEPVIRTLVRQMLERGGFNVIEADDAPSVLEMGDDCEFDVLVTDLSMPGMRGDDLAARLRDARPDVRVLFISGNVPHSISTNLDPYCGVLPKPFGSADLLDAVGQLVARPLSRVA
jgi:two-component system, cell cycle sensor histidine kinase and response regulator CckA